jgi:hypothetical protein
MTKSRFNELKEDLLTKCENLFEIKSYEYSRKQDVLHNFKQVAKLTHQTTKEALLSLLSKHIVSIYDMGTDSMKHCPPFWDEKIVDAINYLILLKACVLEEYEEETSLL